MSVAGRLARQFGWFVVVGVAGFLIDAGVTIGLARLGWSPRAARLPGLALAIVFTWLANGRLAFGDRRSGGFGELARYASVALAVAALNYAVYSLLVGAIGSIAVAIALATAVSMFASFAGYRALVFTGGRAR